MRAAAECCELRDVGTQAFGAVYIKHKHFMTLFRAVFATPIHNLRARMAKFKNMEHVTSEG